MWIFLHRNCPSKRDFIKWRFNWHLSTHNFAAQKTWRFHTLKTWIYFWFSQKKSNNDFSFFHKLVRFYREMFPVSFECYATFGCSFNAAVFLESKKEKKNPIVKLKVQQHACMNNNGNYEHTARSLCGSYEMCNYMKILIAHANWWNVEAKKSVYESSTILTTVRHTFVHRIQLGFFRNNDGEERHTKWKCLSTLMQRWCVHVRETLIHFNSMPTDETNLFSFD